MFFKVMLFGLLFAAAAASRIAQDTSSLSLLVLGGLWWLLAPPVGEGNLDERDRGNQQLPEKTEDAAEINQPNNHVDATDGKEHSSTVLDPSLRQSLRKVFDCSYSQFILLWYNPPEPTEDQPLYRVLLDEFNTTVDHAVKKIRNLDLISIESGLIRILTVHLRTAKKEKREKIFQTRDEEMCFLRSTSEALICNLLPGSLWSVNCYRQLIKEVVALKVLEEVINKICDADFINQALIEFLDKDLPATIEKEVIPDVPPKTEKNAEIITECYISNGKMKKKSKKTNVPRKFQKYFKKIFKKSKKREDPEVDSTVDGTDEIDGQFRCLSYSDALYLENRVDDSADEEHLISSDEISKWAERTVPASSLRNCKITISEISWDEMEDPSCTIDVEDLKVAEDCWSVHRKFHEFQDLQKELNKTLSSFVEAKLSSVNGMSPDQINNEFKEDVKRQLTVFLEMLVSEESILCNDIVLNFFSPNDQIREYWGLLTSLFTEDDEESYAGSDTSEDLCDLDVDDVGGEVEPPGTNPENRETQAWESVEFQTFEKCESDKYLGFRTISGTENPVAADLHLNCVDGRKRRKCAPQKKIERTAEQPECISSQLCELLGEIICAESSNVNRTILLLVKSFLQKYLQKKLDQFFNKEQMTICIDRLRETLWPNGKPAEPPPNRTNEEKAFAKERAEELLQNRVSALPPFLLNKKANARTLFAIFQDAETNKRLVYNVLVFLLFELIPGIKVSWNGDVMPCLKNLDVDELNDKPL